jgi:hypothetical protein
MKPTFITVLTAALATSTGVSASPTPPSEGTSPNLQARGIWYRDECYASIGGTVVGGSTLWMLRNTWNNKFGGDFSGSLGVGTLHLSKKAFSNTVPRTQASKACAVGVNACGWHPRGKADNGRAMLGEML